MTKRRRARRFSPRPRRLPGAQGVLLEILAVASGASNLAQPAFERHETVEIR